MKLQISRQGEKGRTKAAWPLSGEVMNCSRCGSKIEKDWAFCPRCGFHISGEYWRNP